MYITKIFSNKVKIIISSKIYSCIIEVHSTVMIFGLGLGFG